MLNLLAVIMITIFCTQLFLRLIIIIIIINKILYVHIYIIRSVQQYGCNHPIYKANRNEFPITIKTVTLLNGNTSV